MTASGNISIRDAVLGDADAISGIIVRTLRETNSKDYPPAVIDKLAGEFSPDRVAARIANARIIIATEQGRIVGTAGLDGSRVRSVFVLPDRQGRGVGLLLMSHIEQIARAGNIGQLNVVSSVTAETFYSKLGFLVVREKYDGEERTIVMTKHL